jgi:hypothetical protein
MPGWDGTPDWVRLPAPDGKPGVAPVVVDPPLMVRMLSNQLASAWSSERGSLGTMRDSGGELPVLGGELPDPPPPLPPPPPPPLKIGSPAAEADVDGEPVVAPRAVPTVGAVASPAPWR